MNADALSRESWRDDWFEKDNAVCRALIVVESRKVPKSHDRFEKQECCLGSIPGSPVY
jgi:hypothetical protein